MAYKKLHRTEDFIEQENFNSRLTVKSALAQPLIPVHVRSALGEVGNKISSQQDNIEIKKNGFAAPAPKDPKQAVRPTQAKPPPQAKKLVAAVALATKKEPKKVQEKTTVVAKPGLKRQESILLKKNVINGNDDTKTSNKEKTKSKQQAIVDPDDHKKHDPFMVTEYVPDIFTYLRSLEAKYSIKENFLDGHETTPRMRSILVNWLVDVQINFKLLLETFHICVSIVDRYLQATKHVGRSSLQLVGTTALLLACKYEEMYVPDLKDFVYICDNSFSERQILTMEREILKKLDFSLGRPVSVLFLRRYNKVAQAKIEHHTLGKYMLELSLMEYEMCHVPPSLLAAAACLLSMAILNEVMDIAKLWTPTMVHYTSYEYSDFRYLLPSLASIIVKSESSKFQAIRHKYSTVSYDKISLHSKLNGPLVRKLISMKK